MRCTLFFWRALPAIIGMILVSCASGVLQYEQVEKLEINEEYDKMIKVKELEPKEPPPTGAASPGTTPATPEEKSPDKGVKKTPDKAAPTDKAATKKAKPKGSKAVSDKAAPETPGKPAKKEPDLEDGEGFLGRRPEKDPFGFGEKITFNVKYFAMAAGELTLESRPILEVNGRRSYHFVIGVKTHSFFSRVYEVDDWAETYMDYDQMVPYNLAVHVKETNQLKESRSVYDFNTGKANFWEKKVTKEKGEVNQKLTWDILPFSQNVISAIFYVRTFTLRVGKSVAFRVADAGKNIIFRAEVLREERLETPGGSFDTFVLKLEFEQDGVFKKTGDVFLWLTKNERKFPVKVESKIKVGTLVGNLKELQPGKLP